MVEKKNNSLKPIRNEEDYSNALKRTRGLMDAEPGTPEFDELEVLSILIESYEDIHYPIEAPDPVEAIKFTMEQQGLERKDLEPFIGPKTRISEIFNRKRSLTVEMIKKLHKGLGIPLESLIGS